MNNLKDISLSLSNQLKINDTNGSELIISNLSELLLLTKELSAREYIGNETNIINEIKGNLKLDNSSNELLNKQKLLSLRLLRNLCAHLPHNQESILNNVSAEWLLNQLLQSNTTESIFIAIMQLLINSIASNQKTQTILWNQCFKSNNNHSILQLLLENNKEDLNRLQLILMMIYNLILSDNERKNNLVSPIGKNVLERILCIVEHFNQDDEQHDQLFHWSYLIFKNLYQFEKFVDIFKLFGDKNYDATTPQLKDIRNHPIFQGILGQDNTDLSNNEPDTKDEYDHLDGRLNKYHIILLNLLDAMVNKQRNVKEYLPEDDPILSIDSCLFILNELSILYNIDFKKKSASASSTMTRLNEFDFSAIYFIFKIFANVTCYSDEMLALKLKDDQEDLNTLLRKRGLVAICVGTLHSNPEIDVSIRSQTSEPDNTSKDKGFKVEIIRILGNLAFRNKGNQDEIRELGGMQLILNHCKIDPKNMYIKEWSVFAIRNLCEENMANQEIIEELRMKGVSNKDELEALGISISVSEGGALKFSTTK